MDCDRFSAQQKCEIILEISNNRYTGNRINANDNIDTSKPLAIDYSNSEISLDYCHMIRTMSSQKDIKTSNRRQSSIDR